MGQHSESLHSKVLRFVKDIKNAESFNVAVIGLGGVGGRLASELGGLTLPTETMDATIGYVNVVASDFDRADGFRENVEIRHIHDTVDRRSHNIYFPYAYTTVREDSATGNKTTVIDPERLRVALDETKIAVIAINSQFAQDYKALCRKYKVSPDRRVTAFANVPEIRRLAPAFSDYPGTVIMVTNQGETLSHELAAASGLDPYRIISLAHIDQNRGLLYLHNAVRDLGVEMTGLPYNSEVRVENVWTIGTHHDPRLVLGRAELFFGDQPVHLPITDPRFAQSYSDRIKNHANRQFSAGATTVDETVGGILATIAGIVDRRVPIIAGVPYYYEGEPVWLTQPTEFDEHGRAKPFTTTNGPWVESLDDHDKLHFERVRDEILAGHDVLNGKTDPKEVLTTYIADNLPELKKEDIPFVEKLVDDMIAKAKAHPFHRVETKVEDASPNSRQTIGRTITPGSTARKPIDGSSLDAVFYTQSLSDNTSEVAVHNLVTGEKQLSIAVPYHPSEAQIMTGSLCDIVIGKPKKSSMNSIVSLTPFHFVNKFLGKPVTIEGLWSDLITQSDARVYVVSEEGTRVDAYAVRPRDSRHSIELIHEPEYTLNLRRKATTIAGTGVGSDERLFIADDERITIFAPSSEKGLTPIRSYETPPGVGSLAASRNTLIASAPRGEMIHLWNHRDASQAHPLPFEARDGRFALHPYAIGRKPFVYTLTKNHELRALHLSGEVDTTPIPETWEEHGNRIVALRHGALLVNKAKTLYIPDSKTEPFVSISVNGSNTILTASATRGLV